MQKMADWLEGITNLFYRQNFILETGFITVILMSILTIADVYFSGANNSPVVNSVFVGLMGFIFGFGLLLILIKIVFDQIQRFRSAKNKKLNGFDPKWVPVRVPAPSMSLVEFGNTYSGIFGLVCMVILVAFASYTFFSQLYVWYIVAGAILIMLAALGLFMMVVVKGVNLFSRQVLYGSTAFVLLAVAGFMFYMNQGKGNNTQIVETSQVEATTIPNGVVVELESGIISDQDIAQALPELNDEQAMGQIQQHFVYIGSMVHDENQNLIRFRDGFLSATATESKKVNWDEYLYGTESSLSAEVLFNRINGWYNVGYVTDNANSDYVSESFSSQLDKLTLTDINRENFKVYSRLLVDASRIAMELGRASKDIEVDESKVGIARDWQRQLDAVYNELNQASGLINATLGYEFISLRFNSLGDDYMDLMIAASANRSVDVSVTATPDANFRAAVINLQPIVTLVPTVVPSEVPTIEPTSTLAPTPEVAFEPHQEVCRGAGVDTAYAWEQAAILHSFNSFEYTVPVSFGYWDNCPNTSEYFVFMGLDTVSGTWLPTLVNTIPGGTTARTNYRFFYIKMEDPDRVDIAPAGDAPTYYDVVEDVSFDPHEKLCQNAENETAYAWEQISMLYALDYEEFSVPMATAFWQRCPNRNDKYLMFSLLADGGYATSLVNTVAGGTIEGEMNRYFVVSPKEVQRLPMIGTTIFDVKDD